MDSNESSIFKKPLRNDSDNRQTMDSKSGLLNRSISKDWTQMFTDDQLTKSGFMDSFISTDYWGFPLSLFTCVSPFLSNFYLNFIYLGTLI